MSFFDRRPPKCGVDFCSSPAALHGMCTTHAQQMAMGEQAARVNRDNQQLEAQLQQLSQPGPPQRTPLPPPLPGRECTWTDDAGMPCGLARVMDPDTAQPIPGIDRCALPGHQR